MKPLVVAILLLASPARAETVTRWYGWQILLADAVFLGTTFAARSPVPLLGTVVSGPVIHAANGNWATGLASLGARTVMPYTGAILGDLLCVPDDDEWFPCVEEAVLGLFGGYLVALAIDLGVARKTRHHEVVPLVQLGRDGGVAGVSVAF